MDRRLFIKSLIGIGLISGIDSKISALEKEEIPKLVDLSKNREYVEIIFSNTTCITVPKLSNLSTYQKSNIWFGMDVDNKQILAIPAIFFDMYGRFNLAVPIKNQNLKAYIVRSEA